MQGLRVKAVRCTTVAGVSDAVPSLLRSFFRRKFRLNMNIRHRVSTPRFTINDQIFPRVFDLYPLNRLGQIYYSKKAARTKNGLTQQTIFPKIALHPGQRYPTAGVSHRPPARSRGNFYLYQQWNESSAHAPQQTGRAGSFYRPPRRIREL